MTVKYSQKGPTISSKAASSLIADGVVEDGELVSGGRCLTFGQDVKPRINVLFDNAPPDIRQDLSVETMLVGVSVYGLMIGMVQMVVVLARWQQRVYAGVRPWLKWTLVAGLGALGGALMVTWWTS